MLHKTWLRSRLTETLASGAKGLAAEASPRRGDEVVSALDGEGFAHQKDVGGAAVCQLLAASFDFFEAFFGMKMKRCGGGVLNDKAQLLAGAGHRCHSAVLSRSSRRCNAN